jgi:L-seryl-tRNA(Ser) seleniumtransferase
MADARRAIPSVERLLASPAIERVLRNAPRPRVVELLRVIQDEVRTGVSSSGNGDADWYACQLEERLSRADRRSLHSVINATGVVLHTNLGRAPLSAAALAAVAEVAAGYSNLEYDVAGGERGSRYTHCRELLTSLTGAEAALVVNNNAAALTLAMNTFALAAPVVISRGELVEIGDSFRIAEIAARSGVQLREVGATNRTHARDYQEAMPGAAAVLKVHPSNFAVTGFTGEVSAAELAKLTHAAGIPFVHDLGSGLIESLDDLGLKGEPTAAQAIAAGADVVTMSGDKLLGGPQAGILLGRQELVAAMQRNPLCRALRVDKLTLAALEATLQSYARGNARTEIPVLRMLAATHEQLHERAVRLLTALPEGCEIADGFSAVGGGAFPGAAIPTVLILLPAGNAVALEASLRLGAPTVIARITNDRVALDLRTVLADQDVLLAARITNG